LKHPLSEPESIDLLSAKILDTHNSGHSVPSLQYNHNEVTTVNRNTSNDCQSCFYYNWEQMLQL
jgi:hypothetical protein